MKDQYGHMHDIIPDQSFVKVPLYTPVLSHLLSIHFFHSGSCIKLLYFKICDEGTMNMNNKQHNICKM